MPIEKLRPSFTLDEDRIEALRQVVPEAFADGQIDWETLREVLDDHVADEEDERFGLFWPGKKSARRLASRLSRGTLIPDLGESEDVEDTQNLFIEGENLEVLKLLQKSYAGQVKMIYLDPPYNTGKDLIYKDDYAEPLGTYLKNSGALSPDGELLSSNTRSDGRFHSSWLNMMYPRLQLARNLLASDGLLFVSIDDNEYYNLKHLLDEIFGSTNYLETFVWVNEGNIDNQSVIKNNHEYIVVYAKDEDNVDPPPVIDPNIPEHSKLYNRYIENTIVKNGPKNPKSGISLPSGFPANFESGTINPEAKDEDFWPKLSSKVRISEYELQNQVTAYSGWSSKDLLEQFIANDFEPITDSKGQKTVFHLTETGAIYVKKERTERQSHVLSVLQGMGTVQEASSELEKIGIQFQYPKPVNLIKYLIKVGSHKGSIIMDFFAGSGTTGEAVQRLNQEDGGDRNFILCQLPTQISDEDHETISQLARERLKRSRKRILNDGQLELEEDRKRIDCGFKFYSLDESNFKNWLDYEGVDVGEIESLFDQYETPLIDGWQREDLLVEVLLMQGYPLDSNIEELSGFDQNEVLKVTTDLFSSRLFVCLDESIADETIISIDLSTNDSFVCLDSALTDEAKMRLQDATNLKVI